MSSTVFHSMVGDLTNVFAGQSRMAVSKVWPLGHFRATSWPLSDREDLAGACKLYGLYSIPVYSQVTSGNLNVAV